MCVDLSKAKPGMVAKFRCGGEAEIVLVRHRESRSEDPFDLEFRGYNTGGWRYAGDGQFHQGITNQPFDIIELIDPPFDWKEVKPGMAFKWLNKDIHHYVGIDACGFHVLSAPRSYQHPYGGWKTPEQEFTRAPEHDIEVK